MKSKLVIFLFFSFLFVNGFSQMDCPGRAENEKFINDFIKKEQKKNETETTMPSSVVHSQQNVYKPVESSQFESWCLHWKETHDYYFSRYMSYAKDQTVEFDWDNSFSSQEECTQKVLELMAEVHTDWDYSLSIQIIEDCHPCMGTQKNYTHENGHWKKKIPTNEKKPEQNTTQNALGEALKKNLANIPCGTIITNIKTLENGKYEIEIEQKQGSKPNTSDENIALRKVLDDFYAKLRVDFENKKQEQSNLQQKVYQDGQTKYANLTETTESSKTSYSNIEGMLSPQEVFVQNSNIANQYGVKMPGENGEPDFIRVEGYHGNTVDFHYDEKGSLFYYTVYKEDGSVTTYYDTNENGKPDQQVTITPGEQPQYLAIKENPGDNQGIMLNDIKETIDLGTPWETKTKKQIQAERIAMRNAQLNDQVRKPWEDGYIFKEKPLNNQQKISNEFTSTYGLVGIGNSSISARNGFQDIANSSGLEILGITSSFENQNSELNQVTESDISQAIDIMNGQNTIATEVLKNNIIQDLRAGIDVQVICHSRGCAETYNAIKDAQEYFDQREMGSLMNNVTVITLGGFCPTNKDEWNTPADIIPLRNPGDAVPAFREYGSKWSIPSDLFLHTVEVHPLQKYLPWLDYMRINGKDDLIRNQYKTYAPPPINK